MNSLIIPPNTIRVLPPQAYIFDHIEIGRNAGLVITKNATRWMMLESTGDFILDGTIHFTNFIVSTDEFVATTRKGMTLTHRFTLAAMGGKGGRGTKVYTASGGQGAYGTTSYGGGGGGGACSQASGKKNGENAVEWRRGRGGCATSSNGGDGGRPAKYGCGGLLYISAERELRIGNGGKVELFGVNGEDGKNGQNGFFSAPYGDFGGGAGGGAPGLEGGVLLYSAASGNFQDLLVNVEGGIGGKRGIGGFA